ncbi:MAG TPA: hypothetical protein VM582_03415 [Candidatus Thermoplasmatota archaeon]|nr:hypothetical protein [Candidatus Thermoplasmatota archaeon]
MRLLPPLVVLLLLAALSPAGAAPLPLEGRIAFGGPGSVLTGAEGTYAGTYWLASGTRQVGAPGVHVHVLVDGAHAATVLTGAGGRFEVALALEGAGARSILAVAAPGLPTEARAAHAVTIASTGLDHRIVGYRVCNPLCQPVLNGTAAAAPGTRELFVRFQGLYLSGGAPVPALTRVNTTTLISIESTGGTLTYTIGAGVYTDANGAYDANVSARWSGGCGFISVHSWAHQDGHLSPTRTGGLVLC